MLPTSLKGFLSCPVWWTFVWPSPTSLKGSEFALTPCVGTFVWPSPTSLKGSELPFVGDFSGRRLPLQKVLSCPVWGTFVWPSPTSLKGSELPCVEDFCLAIAYLSKRF